MKHYKLIHQDMIGKKFGRLVVISVEKLNKYYIFNCICDCGEKTSPNSFSVRNGTTTSCGCLHKEKISKKKDKPSKLIKPDAESRKNYVYLTYRTNARKRQYDFNLTRTQFDEIIVKDCHYCGKSKSQISSPPAKKKSKPFIYTGIDRVDNAIGYTIENCVPCCNICNKAKGTLSYFEYLLWIDNLINFNIWRKNESNKVL